MTGIHGYAQGQTSVKSNPQTVQPRFQGLDAFGSLTQWVEQLASPDSANTLPSDVWQPSPAASARKATAKQGPKKRSLLGKAWNLFTTGVKLAVGAFVAHYAFKQIRGAFFRG